MFIARDRQINDHRVGVNVFPVLTCIAFLSDELNKNNPGPSSLGRAGRRWCDRCLVVETGKIEPTPALRALLRRTNESRC